MTRCEQMLIQSIIHFEDSGDMSNPLALDTRLTGVNNKSLRVAHKT